MNNFFFDSSDYSIFKKAYKTTRNEPVIINILSSDSSLKQSEDPNRSERAARKNMSNRFEPNSPFGKFFGPRKPSNNPVDMKDFSSWKNKNYRKIEENLDVSENNGKPKFSLSDYLKNRAQNKYQNTDQTKYETQKPIQQISTEDPAYKRLFLNRFMNNIEEQSKVKTKFEENDDLLEPLGESTQQVVPDSSQDEDFESPSNFDIEEVVFEDDDEGNKFKIEMAELDKIKEKLDEIEKRSQEKPAPKEEKQYFVLGDDSEEESTKTQQTETEETTADAEEPAFEEPAAEEEQAVSEDDIQEADGDNEFDDSNEEQPQQTDYTPYNVNYFYQGESPDSTNYLYQTVRQEDDREQAEMQAKLNDILEKDSAQDQNIETSLINSELEKQKVVDEYEIKMSELEESYKKHVEELKQQSYLEKLEREAKFDEFKNDLKIREREISEREKSSLSMLNSSAMLKSELKSNLNISNLEMDKKLLELKSENNEKEIDLNLKNLSEIDTTKSETKKSSSSKSKATAKVDLDVSAKTAPKKRRKRTKRRKIDSDIVGNFNFD